jgi:hypothetical protein
MREIAWTNKYGVAASLALHNASEAARSDSHQSQSTDPAGRAYS